jgi:hypothetical protein
MRDECLIVVFGWWEVLLERAKQEVRADSEERQYNQTNIQKKINMAGRDQGMRDGSTLSL